MPEHRVYGLRVKRREGVRRIGFEIEKLRAPSGPFRPVGVRLVRCEGIRDDAAVPKTVVNRLASIDFDTPHDVRMMPDNDIGAGVDGGPGERTFITGKFGRRMNDALMHGDDDEVRLAPHPADVRFQDLSGCWRHCQRRQRRYRPAINGCHRQVGTTGTIRRGPTGFGAYAVVAQQGDVAGAERQPRRPPRLVEIATGAAGASGSPAEQEAAARARGRQDVLNLSDRGRVVAEAASAVANSRDVRAEKVAALKAAIANGTYSSNAREIAARLIANGLGND